MPELPRRAGLVLAALGMAAALVAVPAHGAQSDPTGDAKGPLDLVSASLVQQRTALVFEVRTAGVWTPSQIERDAPGRYLCLYLFAARAAQPRADVCVTTAPGSTRAALRYSTLSRTGRTLSSRRLNAPLSRPDERSLHATLDTTSVGLSPGRFGWQVRSAWTGIGDCPGGPEETSAQSSACEDRLPDRRTLNADLKPTKLVGCVARRPGFWARGPGHRKEVALTFDDGPSAYTPQVLRILRREHVHGTFFLIGEQVAPFARLAREELAEGNMVGNHTFTHANVAGGNYSQLARTQRAIRATTGFTPCLFRPPYGAYTGALVRQALGLGLDTIFWDVDPRDWSRPGTGAIYARYDRLVGGARRESILLMHDGGGPRNQTVAALPHVIATLRSRGYRFVTVDELLGLRRIYA